MPTIGWPSVSARRLSRSPSTAGNSVRRREPRHDRLFVQCAERSGRPLRRRGGAEAVDQPGLWLSRLQRPVRPLRGHHPPPHGRDARQRPCVILQRLRSVLASLTRPPHRRLPGRFKVFFATLRDQPLLVVGVLAALFGGKWLAAEIGLPLTERAVTQLKNSAFRGDSRDVLKPPLFAASRRRAPHEADIGKR